jgi:agmatinase
MSYQDEFESDYPHFLGSEISQAAPEQARFHIIPVPYEHTVSYGGGTAEGPSAILKASWQLEKWEGKSKPCAEGIHTRLPVDCSGEPEQVIQRIAEANAEVLKLGKMPITIGGEHTVTYGVLRGFIDAGITDIGVVQIDAHADLRDSFEGTPYSHACAMKRIVDMGIPMFQLGNRAYCEAEMATREKHGVHYLDADDLVPGNVTEIQLPDDFPENVFFTLDIDGMDPSVFPSTGTPVPGGLGWYQTLSLFESVAKQRRIVGFDLMEFAPIPGFHAYDFAASMLIYKMMGIVQRNS